MGSARELSYAESREIENPCYVDVRAPSEYAADHIPGALNLPLFDDAERAKIGEIYHNISQDQARLAGLELVAPKLPQLIKALAEIGAGSDTGAATGAGADGIYGDATGQIQTKRGIKHQPVLYCWRGGLRSLAVAGAAELMGIPCLRLRGGYRDYRHWLMESIKAPLPFKTVVLHGLTGCGKTAILHLLKHKHGLQTVDLEGLAKHRGSVFGHIGLGEQPTQKYFQSLLYHELAGLDTARPVIVECESRRIGRLLLDEPFYEAMRRGARILLYDTPAGRTQRLLTDYEPHSHMRHISAALQSPPLQRKFGARNISGLTASLQAGAYEEVISFLLTHYYDPLYHYPHQPAKDYALCADSGNEEQAAAAIAEFIAKL